MRNRLWVLVVAMALTGVGGGQFSRVMAEGGAPAVAEKKVTDDQLKALIEKLGSEDFKVRTAAHKELVAAGTAALPALEQATHSGDAEVVEQAKGAMQEIHRALAAAATEALVKQQLWCYAMENGAAWSNNSAWPVIFGGTAYVAGMDSKLHAVDLQTGKGRWTADLGAKGFGGMQVSAGEKLVSLLQQTTLTVYETKEGKQLWQKDFKPVKGNVPGPVLQGGPAAVPPAPAAGGAAGGAAAAKPGMFVAGPMMGRNEAWVVGDLVVARSGDKINAYKGQGGEDAWEMDVKRGNMACNSVVAEGVMYVSKEQSVAAIDLGTQKELWSKEMPGLTKLARGGQALVCVAGPKIVALDVKKGDKLWESEIAAAGGGAPGPLMPQGAGAANNAIVFNGGMQMRRVAVDDARVYVVAGETLTMLDLKTGGKTSAALDISDENGKEGGAPGANVMTTTIQGGAAAAGGGPAAGVVMVAHMRTMINQLAVADGTLYAVTNAGLMAFEGKSGGRLWTIPLKQVLPTEPVVVGGVLYYATNGRAIFGVKNVAIKAPVAAPGAGGAAAADAPAADAPPESPLSLSGLHALKLAK